MRAHASNVATTETQMAAETAKGVELLVMLGQDVVVKTDGNLHLEKFELLPKKRAGGSRQRSRERPASGAKGDKKTNAS
jgi:hypothetical protein